MRVLLISANRERAPYPVFPIGLAYLADVLATAGHVLEAVDLCFEKRPEQAVREALEAFRPGVIVISIRNVDNVTWPATRFYLDPIREIVESCRGDAPIIVGGSGFSLLPVQILSFLGADYGIVGEGDDVLPMLVASLERGEDPGDLPGLVRKGKDQFPPSRPARRIGTPDRTLFHLERYDREGGMANLQTKRGCPFSCIYCTYPLLEGNRIRLRPIPEIIREIGSLVEGAGVNYLYFVDDIFNYPPGFAVDLCRAIIEARLCVKWSAFIHPGFVDRPLMEAMVNAGCDAVEFGTESGAPAMLASLGKSFGVDQIRSASAVCRELGVDFAHYILFGGPGESEATVLETFSLMDEAAPTAVIAMTGIRIFPGTALHTRAMADGIIGSDDPLLEPAFYISPLLGERLAPLVTDEAMKRLNWVAPGLELNMSDAMLEALRQFKVRGPLWKLVKRLGRSRVKPM